MKNIVVTTGFGYVQNSLGVPVAKLILPAGVHQIRNCESYVEVANQTELDAIQIQPDTSFVPVDDADAAIIWKYGSFTYQLRLREDNRYEAVVWSHPSVPKPDVTALNQIITDYINSKDYAQAKFVYETAMEELNRQFWNRMNVLAPVVGLVDLWMRWKNFSALKTKCTEWVADPAMAFEQQDFDLLNTVLKQQNIDLLQW